MVMPNLNQIKTLWIITRDYAITSHSCSLVYRLYTRCLIRYIIVRFNSLKYTEVCVIFWRILFSETTAVHGGCTLRCWKLGFSLVWRTIVVERLIRIVPKTGHVPRLILHRQDRECAHADRRRYHVTVADGNHLDRNCAVRTNIPRSWPAVRAKLKSVRYCCGVRDIDFVYIFFTAPRICRVAYNEDVRHTLVKPTLNRIILI